MKAVIYLITVALLTGSIFYSHNVGNDSQPLPTVSGAEEVSLASDAQTGVSSCDIRQDGKLLVPSQINEHGSTDVKNFTSEQIQETLKTAGFYRGIVDGKLGPKTKDAIKRFQAKNDLKADGIVGRQTWTLLKGYLQM